jgi:hypothetical protein
MHDRRLTDSPWFWLLVFSLFALVGIAVISPKYDRRQGQIEGRFLGREQAAAERARRAAGLPAKDLAAEAGEPAMTAMTPGRRLIPLWPVMIAVAGVAAASAAMLVRERRAIST